MLKMKIIDRTVKLHKESESVHWKPIQFEVILHGVNLSKERN